MANNLSAFNPEIWSRRVIANINQVNVALAVITNSDYEGEIRDSGDTVQVRTYGSITVNDYTRNQTIAAESLVPTKETMTIDSSKYFAFDVDDLDQVQNDLNAINGYTERAGVAMSNAVDSFVLGKALAGANSSNAVGTAASPINITAATAGTTVYDQIVDAGLTLDLLDVPEAGRWIIITPYAKSLLLKDTTNFIRASALGDAIVMSGRLGMSMGQARQVGYLGQCANFDVWMSNHVPTNGTYWACIYGQGRPVSYAAQIPPSKMEALRLENTFATRVRGLMLQGAQTFAENSKRLGVLYIDNS